MEPQSLVDLIQQLANSATQHLPGWFHTASSSLTCLVCAYHEAGGTDPVLGAATAGAATVAGLGAATRVGQNGRTDDGTSDPSGSDSPRDYRDSVEYARRSVERWAERFVESDAEIAAGTGAAGGEQ